MENGKKIAPKFKTHFLGTEIPSDPRLPELKYWCSQFHKFGLAPPYEGGSYGNLSFRLKKNEFIITGSKIGLKENLGNDCFVRVVSCDFKNQIVSAYGKKEPSSESMLHYAIYEKRKDINAIFHGHNLSMLDKNIPETKHAAPYGTIELVDSVLEIVNEGNLLIIKDHGFISLGKTMGEAGKLACPSP